MLEAQRVLAKGVDEADGHTGLFALDMCKAAEEALDAEAGDVLGRDFKERV